MRLLIFISILFLANLAGGAEEWQRHLPPEWLGVIVVHDLPDFDRQAEGMAKLFGMDAPGLVRLLEAAGLTGVTDAEGSWLAGLARGPQGAEEPYPFAMIPTEDFAALVKALDGDMAGRTAIVTLAQQDLLAGNCGTWALLMNPAQQHVFDSVMKRAADEKVDKGFAAGDGIAAAHVSKLGLQWLASYKSAGDEARQLVRARRKRGLAMLSLDGARESLMLDKPVWQWAAAEFEGVAVKVEFDEVGGARVRVGTAKPQAADAARPSGNGAGVGALGDREWISVGAVQPSPELVELATGGYLALLKSRPEELGVKEFPEAELAALEAAIEGAAGQVSVAHIATLVGDELPVYGNRAAVLHVAQPDDFLAACEELMRRWNALIAASQAEVKFSFAAESIEVANSKGRQYYVDMVEAVDVPRSPEVTKVMTDMFGAEGVLSWYVLPIEGERILVANLPRGEVEKLIGELNEEDAKPQAVDGSGTLKLDASAYVDWGKRRDRAMMGRVIGGPPFVPLPKSEPLDASLRMQDGGVKIELTLPQSLLQTLGKHAQEMR